MDNRQKVNTNYLIFYSTEFEKKIVAISFEVSVDLGIRKICSMAKKYAEVCTP